MRHPPTIITNIKRMRIANFTLGEIITKTSLPKTTIYYHIRSIPKSETLTSKISSINRAMQKVQAVRRRGKSVKGYKFSKPGKWTADFVNLIAHFLFDGQIRYASCLYHNRSPVLIEHVVNLAKRVLGTDDYKRYIDKNGVVRISYNNVELANFIRVKSEELPGYIICAPEEQKISFLTAFFDDEGCITFSKKKRIIRGYQHNERILILIQKLLRGFDIESKVDARFNEIVISRHPNLGKFAKQIGFMRGLCVNGKRTNSIWKKDLEKTRILEMALNSYSN